jgi:adenylate cyclase
MRDRNRSLRKLLTRSFSVLVLLPGLILVSIVTWFTHSFWLAAAGAAAVALQLLFQRRLEQAIRIRMEEPMIHFRSTLEDISEGFIVDALPADQFKGAEPAISEAAQAVLHINQLMLRNVDNLEKGYEEERLAKLRQLELTQAYERFVPKEFLGFLNKASITEVKLGDHVETRMTVMFADMRSFTTLSEQIQPEENFHLLNDYFARMDPVVKAHGGFIDKYIGDGIMALFHQDTDAAVDAAIGMIRGMYPFNEKRQLQGFPPIRIGIGLNTGRLMLGIVGGQNRMEGTVISDAVNVAARLEDLNKCYGTSLLLSEESYASLLHPERYGIRRLDRITVKGKTQSVDLYEVFDMDTEDLSSFKAASKAEFEEAVRLYVMGEVTEAGIKFRTLADAHPGDTAARYLAERCFGGRSRPQS